MACHNWQVDVRPGAVSDLGGARDALMVLAWAHHEHVADCPAAGGRIRFEGKWVDPPKMSDGTTPSGLMQLNPVPKWWVAR